MLQRTDAITSEVLQPITFVLAHRTISDVSKITMLQYWMNTSIIITLGYCETALKYRVRYVGGFGVRQWVNTWPASNSARNMFVCIASKLAFNTRARRIKYLEALPLLQHRFGEIYDFRWRTYFPRCVRADHELQLVFQRTKMCAIMNVKV